MDRNGSDWKERGQGFKLRDKNGGNLETKRSHAFGERCSMLDIPKQQEAAVKDGNIMKKFKEEIKHNSGFGKR